MSQTIDRTAFGNRQQPGARVARNAIHLPAFQRIHQGILQGVLSQLEVSKLTDESRQDPPMFFAEGLFDLCCGAHLADNITRLVTTAAGPRSSQASPTESSLPRAGPHPDLCSPAERIHLIARAFRQMDRR